MSRNPTVVVLAVLAVLFALAGALLFNRYRAADRERAALRGQVAAERSELSAARAKIDALESKVSGLTDEAARQHNENQRLLRSGAAEDK